MAERQEILLSVLKSSSEDLRFIWRCPKSGKPGEPSQKEINITTHNCYGAGIVRCTCDDPKCIIAYPPRILISLFLEKVATGLREKMPMVADDNLVAGYRLLVRLNGN